jgi:hypothetical protein
MIAARQADLEIPSVREAVFMVSKVNREGVAGLSQVREASRALPLLLGAAKCREQEACKNRDNSDHHQELDKREGVA